MRNLVRYATRRVPPRRSMKTEYSTVRVHGWPRGSRVDDSLKEATVRVYIRKKQYRSVLVKTVQVDRLSKAGVVRYQSHQPVSFAVSHDSCAKTFGSMFIALHS